MKQRPGFKNMITCLDVDYRGSGACAAAVTIHAWSDANAVSERTIHLTDVAPYEPGQFYRRELPCLLAVLQTLPSADCVVIDGYVWLDAAMKPGLGAHLHEALAGRAAVIGVAKSRFRDAGHALEVFRGTSRKPIFITYAGIPAESAAERIRSMHGTHRIPSILARVDNLCRHGCVDQP